MEKDRPGGGHRRQLQLPGEGEGAVHLVAGRELDEQSVCRVATKRPQNGRIVRQDEESLAVTTEFPRQVEVASTVEVGEQPAEVAVPFGVPGQENRPVLGGDRLGADDRGDSGLLGLLQKVRDTVEAVPVSQSQPA